MTRMGRRGRLLALAVALGGCASGGPIDFPKPDGGVDASSMAGPSCPPGIQLSPGELTGPGEVRASVQSQTGGIYEFRWRVLRAGETTSLEYRATDARQTSIEFTVTRPGSYTVFADGQNIYDGAPCNGQAVFLARPSESQPQATVILRVTPPVAMARLPRQDTILTVTADTPIDTNSILLDEGVLLRGQLASGSTGVAGTVRLVTASGLDVLATAGADGRFQALLLGQETYAPVLAPLDPALAPVQLPAQRGVTLVTQGVYSVNEGVGVTGTIRDDQGSALAGARLSLRSGPLASGVGVSDATGSWRLQAAPGVYEMIAEVRDWPTLNVPPLAIGTGSTFQLEYRLSRVAVQGSVVAADGATPLGGARVTVRSSDAIGQAAILRVGGQTALDVRGMVRVTLITAADGSFGPLLVPPGAYDVLVEPPAGRSEGVTAMVQTASAQAVWRLQLAAKIRLQGVVSDGTAPVAGARVVAVERVGLGAAPSTVTDNSGGFQLLVDPAAAIDLFVDPPAGRALGRAHLVLPAGTSAMNVTLKRGLLIGGTMKTRQGQTIAGARIEVYCATCGDPEPLATGATGDTGRFGLYVPDPGAP
jgi:hypothetical protein